MCRYEDEFREISRLGKGGFGTVYRCRNRLDDSEYAIKKLRLSSDERWSGRMEKVLREVKILAFLDHPHIVRYFHAWLERHDWAGKGYTKSYTTSYIKRYITCKSHTTGAPVWHDVILKFKRCMLRVVPRHTVIRRAYTKACSPTMSYTNASPPSWWHDWAMTG